MASEGAKTLKALRDYALTLPGSHEDFPWGERVAKVAKKVFVFLGKEVRDDGTYGFSVKLPVSKFDALDLPFTEPTGYGLGKAGWVSVSFQSKTKAPIDMFRAWILESYKAVASKKLVKELEDGVLVKTVVKKTKATKKKATKKKAKRA